MKNNDKSHNDISFSTGFIELFFPIEYNSLDAVYRLYYLQKYDIRY